MSTGMTAVRWMVQDSLWYTQLSKSEVVEASESNPAIQDTMEEYKNVER